MTQYITGNDYDTAKKTAQEYCGMAGENNVIESTGYWNPWHGCPYCVPRCPCCGRPLGRPYYQGYIPPYITFSSSCCG